MGMDAGTENEFARIKAKMERILPEESLRRGAFELLAWAVENAADERPNGWSLREGDRSLRLFAGFLMVCEVNRKSVRLSLMGPVSAQVREALEAESSDNEEWRSIPGALMLTFPVANARKALELLQGPVEQFIGVASTRARKGDTSGSHVPAALHYLSRAVGRDLAQPAAPGVESDTEKEPEEKGEPASKEPRKRGRAPIFENGHRGIRSLLDEIERKVIALPDLQRPFVWEDTQVRELLDSLFTGYPVGTLVLWHTAEGREAHALGNAKDSFRATTLVIDGQQRLTSLYAVMRAVEVVDGSGKKRRITIAFRPRDGRFDVSDAAIQRDPEYLPDVSELWKKGANKSQLRRALLEAARSSGKNVGDDYIDAVEENLERLAGIENYVFPVVELRGANDGAGVSEEDVADIFVRINNQGSRLGQADFVLTLLSVFHGELRDRIEARAAEMSGRLLTVDTQQLLRAACAVGFGRARMAAVYKYLRGVDPVTGDAHPDRRAERIKTLDEATDRCLDSTAWRDFVLRAAHAGFVDQGLIASTSAVMNAYAFYVLGRAYEVPRGRLDEVLSRWLFATLLTARYSASSETTFEQDLARVRGAVKEGGPAAFEAALDRALSEVLTGDYWTTTLVRELETQRRLAPAALAFRAAQVVLEARALFSDQRLQNLFVIPEKGKRSASEVHHLFPQAWLAAKGIKERNRVHQVANLADVHWQDNAEIGSTGPVHYVPRLRAALRIDDDRWGRMCAEHALPLGWEKLDYDLFLRERRVRMAEVLRAAYRRLGGERDAPPLSPPWFLPGAEQVWKQIGESEGLLRGVVRGTYAECFGDGAPAKLEAALGEREREVLTRALRARPVGADPLGLVDYLYLGQLPGLLFQPEVWPRAKERLAPVADLKARLQEVVNQLAPVRNEIAHVRPVEQDRLLRASVACADLKALLAR